MASHSGSNTEEMRRLKDEYGGTFDPGVCLLYFSELSRGAAGAEQPTWLIGYRLGRVSHTWVNTAMVIDDHGRPLLSIAKENAGDNGVVFRLFSGTWAVAMSYDSAGMVPGYVRVLPLIPPTRELLRYSGPPTEVWESTLHFVDPNNHGVSAVLIQRAVYNDNGVLLRREFASRGFDERHGKFAPEEAISHQDFEERLRKAKLGGSEVELMQWGSPRESKVGK